MKKWVDLTVEEKLDRLAQVVHQHAMQIPQKRLPGYEYLDVTMTLEGQDDWLGVYPQTRKIP